MLILHMYLSSLLVFNLLVFGIVLILYVTGTLFYEYLLGTVSILQITFVLCTEDVILAGFPGLVL